MADSRFGIFRIEIIRYMNPNAIRSLVCLMLIAPALSSVVPVPKEVAPQAVPGAKPRNVVFILSDDHRFDAMSFLGHQFA